MSKLTDKEDKFCNEYLIDLNQTQAAIRSGYSEKTARQKGSQLLTKVNIQDRIAELQEELQLKTEVTKEKVIKDLLLAREIALGLKPHHIVVKESIGDGVTSTSSKELNKTDINAFIKVNDLLMKHLGMFEKDNDQKKPEFNIDLGTLSTEELIERAKALQILGE